MRYWRRSSRWRKAWKNARKPRNIWRLYALAEGRNPFPTDDPLIKIFYLESLRIMPGIIKAMRGPNPFAIEKNRLTFPKTDSSIRAQWKSI